MRAQLLETQNYPIAHAHSVISCWSFPVCYSTCFSIIIYTLITSYCYKFTAFKFKMARYADYLYESDLEDLFSDEEEVNRAYDHCLAVVLGIVTCDF